MMSEITNTGIPYPDLGGYGSIFSMQEPIRSEGSTPSLNTIDYSLTGKKEFAQNMDSQK